MAGGKDKTGECDLNDNQITSLAYESFKQKVLQWSSFSYNECENIGDSGLLEDSEDFIFEYQQIRPQRLGGVQTKKLDKIYRPILPKGIIGPNFEVLHFGYKKS